jgi:hypothetical protein
MRESDAAAIDEVMSRFLRAVSFDQGGRSSYGDLPDLFVPGGRLIRNSGALPEISTVEPIAKGSGAVRRSSRKTPRTHSARSVT